MSELTGNVAVIRGASSPRGIGAAIAKRFAKASASLFGIAEPGSEEPLTTTVKGCSAGVTGFVFTHSSAVTLRDTAGRLTRLSGAGSHQ
jgi:NAD(P)-dependent dehydrogenase (short-subunit alcohol dehydrogenase family)